MIDQQALLEELQALDRRKAETLAQLHRLDGAIQLTHHLLVRCAGPRPGPPGAPEATETAAANGRHEPH